MTVYPIRTWFLRANWRIAAIGLQLKFVRLRLLSKAGFDPDQPRVSAGHPDGGQWTDAGGGAGGGFSAQSGDGASKPQWLDVDPSRMRLAQAANRGSGSRSRGVGASEPLTPSQATRLDVSQARADAAVARARSVDPSWSPRPGVSQTAEGQIAHNNAVEREANAHYAKLRTEGVSFGPFAAERTDGPGPFTRPSARQRAELQRIGEQFGCHTCGARNPGTRSGAWIFDHQVPSALGGLNAGRWGVPHCALCSRRSGGYIRWILRYR